MENAKPIQVWNYLDEYAAEKDEIHAAIEQVFASGCLILGASGAAFEREYADYCGVRYGVGVDNGTNAITLALRAVGVQPGDEVITVANTAVPTVSAIVTTGAVPRFVDIEPTTYLMDTSQLEAAITSKTKCIVPVHLFGQCVNMDTVRRLATRHGLKVVEDCAQAHGACLEGRRSGSMSDAAAFSFYPTKILGAFGDAGMVVTDDKSIAARLRRLRFYGMDQDYYAEEHGYNCRLDELHAEILRTKLRRLDCYVACRRQLAEHYDARLHGTDIVLPQTAPGNFHAYYLYVVRHPLRDDILQQLKCRNIHLNVSYPWPIHLMRGYASLGYGVGDLPCTEAAAREIFSLPMYPSFSDRVQETVCDALLEVIGDLPSATR